MKKKQNSTSWKREMNTKLAEKENTFFFAYTHDAIAEIPFLPFLSRLLDVHLLKFLYNFNFFIFTCCFIVFNY